MQKQFIKNLVLLLSLNLLIKPFWILGIDRSVQNTVGDGTYGIYLSVFSFTFLFTILLDMGITNFNNRNIAQNKHLLSKHFTGIASLKILLSAFYGVLIFVIGLAIGYRGQHLYLLGWIGVNQVLLSFILYLRSNISGLLLFKTDSFFSVLDRVLMILICSILLWSGWLPAPFRIEWFVYAQTLSYLLTMLAALFFVIRHSGSFKLRFHRPFMLMIIRKSLPFALLALLMSFYNRLEPVLLERMLPEGIGNVQTGIYGKAFRLLDAGNNISLLFSVLLLPMFSSMIKQGQSVNQLVKLSFGIMLSMSLVVAVLAIAYSNNLMSLLYGLREGESIAVFTFRIDQSATVFRLLMGSFVAISTTYIFGTLLTANGSLKTLNIVASIGVIINVAINLLLIPGFQAIGAAWASLGVQITTALIQFLIARKVFNLRFGISFWWRLVVFIILLFAVTFGSLLLPFDWKLNFIIAAVASFLLVFLTRMICIQNLKKLMVSAQELT
ncbi:MAG: polysaccharide biosynthesis C-terminal domain-containing protein [Bacteroidales bacterium]|jgi:O-antigen/teichoic acid export membrane protein|nr:polysaccharide biosynthesis C-terminal domain-containing protein [Bacteroidales bacterium]MDD3701261.1 polysaccharide biosynthesis C-terminal domain-containing protein [Bacteroidales bacterium]MDY0368390.1 polysaccharide biosynthesis C-terminal domain-containing protein [Bacteroidales bacterium]